MSKSEFIIGYVKIQMDDSNWSIRFYADGGVGLFWKDKEYATHRTDIDLEDHISNLRLLQEHS